MSFKLWDYKPWWCQPWSILLTGMAAIITSWWLFSNVLITIIVSLLILSWWFYFLVLYPRLVEKMLDKSTKPQNQ